MTKGRSHLNATKIKTSKIQS